MIFLPRCSCLSGFERELKPFSMQFTKDEANSALRWRAAAAPDRGVLRASVFGFPSDFGLRISDLEGWRTVGLTTDAPGG